MTGSSSASFERPAAPLTERTPRVVSAVKLHRAQERRARRAFLAEGENAVTEAVSAGVAREVFATASWLDTALLRSARAAGVDVREVTDRAAKALSETVTPPGLVAVCDLVDVNLDTALANSPTLVVVAVDIGEPGNAGTLIRVADAAGADAVVFAGDSVDPHNGKSVRASAGSLFHLPVVRERDTAAVLASVRTHGLSVLATTARGELDLFDADRTLAEPTAWLFGNEAHGLPDDVAASADHRVSIPIHGGAESLNLATAVAVCAYASARVQRRVV